MYAESTDRDAARQTSRNDERVTRIGRFIRCTSIDELPQFINVLRDYIENWSTWFDIKIILRTVLLLFYDPAAY